ncbi:hypothetical protein AAFF_G00234320 [Aldrovandia affinis]|uniref:Uncharacterized protein n=1 Tax=Aldrovandia affinis TaxID=143900 RepID=A0AAD7SUU4_9TELE|nr:hypothetical protein AAFF_G00234320 [Aldrovandia affinis]
MKPLLCRKPDSPLARENKDDMEHSANPEVHAACGGPPNRLATASLVHRESRGGLDVELRHLRRHAGPAVIARLLKSVSPTHPGPHVSWKCERELRAGHVTTVPPVGRRQGWLVSRGSGDGQLEWKQAAGETRLSAGLNLEHLRLALIPSQALGPPPVKGARYHS